MAEPAALYNPAELSAVSGDDGVTDDVGEDGAEDGADDVAAFCGASAAKAGPEAPRSTKHSSVARTAIPPVQLRVAMRAPAVSPSSSRSTSSRIETFPFQAFCVVHDDDFE